MEVQMPSKAANKKDLEKLRDLLPKDVKPRDTVWDCHGTWVMYHRFVELIAAHNEVEIVDLTICDVRDKSAVVKCEAKYKDRRIVTFGEAAPGNNKNAYPVAMAEKRAVDRAVLKAVLIHGTFYSSVDDLEMAMGDGDKVAPAAVPEKPAPAPEKKPATPESNAPQTDNVVVQLMIDANISQEMQQLPAVRQGAIQATSANSVDRLRSELQMFRKNVVANKNEAAAVEEIFKCRAKILQEEKNG